MTAEPEYLTVGEVAARLRVSTRSILANIKRGVLPAVRLERAYRIPASALDALRVVPAAPAPEPAPKAPRPKAKARTPRRRTRGTK